MVDVVPIDNLTFINNNKTNNNNNNNSNTGRKLIIGDSIQTEMIAKENGQIYSTNAVCTSKYTLLNFLPKNLFEQFRRIANAYFLMVSLLQLFTKLSPTNKYSTVGPLALVFLATMIKEAIEDRVRHEADYQVNSTKTFILNDNGMFEKRKWDEIRVGHIIKIEKNASIPADIVILQSSEKNSIALVETSNLDGESNLKTRQAISTTSTLMTNYKNPFNNNIIGNIYCENPNRRLYQFDGILKLNEIESNNKNNNNKSILVDKDKEEIIINISNTALRGMSLCNTSWIIGVVITAGKDTKLMQNSKPVPSKFSRLDHIANKCIILIFSMLFILCTVSTILSYTWLSHLNAKNSYYLPFINGFQLSDIPKAWITYLILYNNLVPISLYICLELVKWYQARSIEKDYDMYCPISNKNVLCRTSNINEDVGQIRYIFSDKTGTLTRNEMVFRACSIAGQIFSISSKIANKSSSQIISSTIGAANNIQGIPSTNSMSREPQIMNLNERSDSNIVKMNMNHSLNTGINNTNTLNINYNRKHSSVASTGSDRNHNTTSHSRRFSNKSNNLYSSVSSISDVGTPISLLTKVTSNDDPEVTETIKDFFRCLLLCHTVSRSIHINTNTNDNHIKDTNLNQFDLKSGSDLHGELKASSPDELALLKAAVEFRCSFLYQKDNLYQIILFGEIETYELMALNEFESNRKCMSVVMKREDGSYVLFCKGADSIMLDNCIRDELNIPIFHKVSQHVHYFASMGLRTLAFAKKEITNSFYNDWYKKYMDTKKIVLNRDELLSKVSKIIENDMTLLGATAVEDRLQNGVKETIEKLIHAGINIWMLTGDKDETAISVAHSCGLLSSESRLLLINGKNKQDCLDQVIFHRRKLKREGIWCPGLVSHSLCLVINGSALEYILSESNDTYVNTFNTNHTNQNKVNPHRGSSSGVSTRAASVTSLPGLDSRQSKSNGLNTLNSTEMFLELVTQCISVVACRLSPLQKAQIVSLVRDTESKPMIMAIGDGGNDVSMIQEADVGVGIYGHEGMQAVRAADFAIGQFRFIAKLILVHGRWNYRRVSLVILFSFYKNTALITTLFLYSFLNAYSGQTLYESYLMVGWNVLYTLMPIFILGVIDEDISSFTVLKYPIIFRNNHKGPEFNMKKMICWVTNAIFHSIFIYVFISQIFSITLDTYGKDEGIFSFGTCVYGSLVIVVNLKAIMSMQRIHRWTKFHYISLFGSIWIFFIFVIIYSHAFTLFPQIDFLGDFYGIANIIFNQASIWLALPLVAVSSLMLDIIIMYLLRMYLPTSVNIMEELDSGLAPPPNNQQTIRATKRFKSFVNNGVSNAHLATLSAPKPVWENDFTEPNEHDELCRQLIALEREVAREQGKMDPFLRSEERETALVVAAHPATHPLTMEFMGETNRTLEQEYTENFVLRESKRVHVCMKIITFLILPYAVFEIYSEKIDLIKTIKLRLSMFICACCYLRFTYTKYFIQHYQSSMFLPLATVGIGLTLTITATGKFAITVFPIVLLSVIRVNFLYAIILSLSNFFFYLFAIYMNFTSGTKDSNYSIEDMLIFTFYMFFVISFASYSCYTLQMAMRRDFLQNRSLLLEQRRSTDILNNMLPKHVTERLKKGDTLISEEEKDITILFCDIADFSSIIERFSPTQLVTLLDRIYSLFDEMCSKHGIQKMETVGKTYMACAGIQNKVCEPALRAAAMAYDMLEMIEKIRASNGNGIKLRIGLHSGRVISGLVGVKKQQFSLFGDTVNTASRMQSTGLKGKCQVSSTTYHKIKYYFSFDERNIQVKGKGTMNTYIIKVPISDKAIDAIKGQLDPCNDHNPNCNHHNDTNKRLSTGSTHSMYSNYKNTIVRHSNIIFRNLSMAKKCIYKYDLFNYLFGTIDIKNQDKEDEMQNEINYFFLYFIDIKMEKMFHKITYPKRLISSRQTIIIIGLYMIFAFIRDIILYYTNPYNIIDKSNVLFYVYFLKSFLLRFLYMIVCIIYYYWSFHNKIIKIKSERFQYIIFILYGIAVLCLFIPHYMLLYYEKIVKYRYTDMCLDILYITFVASNGYSLLYNLTMLFNFLTLMIPICMGIHVKTHYEQDTPMYAIVLSFFTSLANCIASRGVEFFTRRKIWLQTRTQQETIKADQLLYQMLPEAVVLRLKTGESVCEQHHGVGILFSDIRGFTTIASRANTDQVVHILDSIFSSFDKYTEKHNVFKVQTIGDAYVIVSGLPYEDMKISESKAAHIAITNMFSQVTSSRVLPITWKNSNRNHSNTSTGTNTKIPKSIQDMHTNSNDINHLNHSNNIKDIKDINKNTRKFSANNYHLVRLIRMAQDMHSTVEKICDPITGEKLQMRIGIHMGSIIGGVIGTTTLRYDMWGPDVLTANELETNGIPEKILVSEVVKDSISGATGIQATYYKNINFTGIGEMKTYIIETDPKDISVEMES